MTAKKNEQPTHIFVRLDAVCNFWLQVYDRGQERPKGAVARQMNDQSAPKLERVILPGLNYIPVSLVQGQGTLGGLNVKLAVVNPCSLDPASAADLATNTTSRDALREWRLLEDRESVIQAIDERLRGDKAA